MYFSMILFKRFRRLPWQNTSLYTCSNSKKVVPGLFKIIQNYVNNNINNWKLWLTKSKKKSTLFPEMRVTRKIFTRVAAFFFKSI